jgi:hypothetical protein
VKTHQQYSWHHCPECHKAIKHHLLKLVLSPTGSINLGFITKGRLAAVLITPSLGVPNWSVIYINTTPSSFSGAVAGEKENFCKGSLSRTIFYFVFVLLYFIFACIFLSKIQKN